MDNTKLLYYKYVIKHVQLSMRKISVCRTAKSGGLRSI